MPLGVWISAQTFRRALTASVDSCAEIKIECPFQWRKQIWQISEKRAGKRCWECGTHTESLPSRSWRSVVSASWACSCVARRFSLSDSVFISLPNRVSSTALGSRCREGKPLTSLTKVKVKVRMTTAAAAADGAEAVMAAVGRPAAWTGGKNEWMNFILRG